MKFFRVILSSVTFCCLAIVSCGKKSDSSSNQTTPPTNNTPQKSADEQQPENEQNTTTPTKTNCPMPAVLSEGSTSKLSSLQEIKASLYGKYELDEVHVYQVGNTPDGKINGTFYGTATRYISNQTYMGVNGIRDTKMDFGCFDFDKNAKIKFLSGITIPVAGVVHFPTGRITIFDENSNLDNPQFNFPSIADVHFDSLGEMSYKNVPKERVGKPPYISNRYISDLAAMWPNDAKFYLRSSNGFEVRFSQIENRDLGQGKSFKATSTVLITYKKSND